MTELNIPVINRLLDHYSKNAPTDWSLRHCVSGVVEQWGLKNGCNNVARKVLGLSGYQTDMIKFARSEDGPSHEFASHKLSPEQNQANVIGMLRRLKATGNVEWRHETVEIMADA